MTANEMAEELELKLDRNDSFSSPGYEDFDLSSVLTEAQHLYIKKFTDELNNRKRTGFEETEARNQGLSALINTATLPLSSDQTGVLVNGSFFDLPLIHMWTIYETCEIDKLVCGSTTDYIVGQIVPMGHNEITRLRKNKYKKPYFKSYGEAKVWRLAYSREVSGVLPSATATNKRHELITDGTFNVSIYTMRYLKNPEDIVVDRDTTANQRNCELDISTHPVIIDLAVDLTLQRIKEQKIQIADPFKEVE